MPFSINSEEKSETMQLSDIETVPEIKRRRRYRGRKSFLVLVLFCLIAVMFGCTTNFIPSESMEPNLIPGDHILTMRRWLAYPFGSMPNHDDIIVFRVETSRINNGDAATGSDLQSDPKGAPTEILIKRVIAVGGEKIRISGNTVFLNDKPLHETYKVTPVVDSAGAIYLFGDNTDYRIPKGEIFVMGDNRNQSDDSRYWGTIKQSDIIGKYVRSLYNEGDHGINKLRDAESKP